MPMMTSREFNRNASRARKATASGPVFITDRGKPSHVLLTIDEYRKLGGKGPGIADLLQMPGAGEIEFDPPTIQEFGMKPVDLS